jgi:glycine betaine/proline transport system substrate-binding protein
MLMRKLLAASATSLVLAAAGHSANAAEPDSCKTIRMADVGWTDNTAQNGLFKNLVKPLGYEVKDDVLGLPIVLEGLKNKDLDLFLDNWMPSNAANVQPYLDEST